MSAVKNAPVRAPRPPSASVGTWPQVDLLPEEIRSARRLRGTQKRLVVVLLVVVLGAMLGYAASVYSSMQARAALTAAQAETARLQSEQAQYAEVPLVLGQIAQVELARVSGTSTEVLWADYFGALQAVTPDGVAYEAVVTDTGSPSAPWTGIASELQPSSTGQIGFTARAASLPDTAAWAEALAGVPGLSNPWFTTATLADEDGAVFYEVTATVDVVDSAFAHRFDPTSEAQP